MRYSKFRRKIRLPAMAILLTVVSWLALAAVVFLVDPEILASFQHLPIWPVFWLALASLIRLITRSWRRGVIYGTAGTAYLAFRYLGIGYWIYGVLLMGLGIVTDWYFCQVKSSKFKVKSWSR